MKRISALILCAILFFTMTACGDNGSTESAPSTDSTAQSTDSTAQSTSSSTVVSTDTASKGDDAYKELFMDIQNFNIQNELTISAKALDQRPKDAVNYIFITDTHIDTTQSQNNEELVLNTINYAIEFSKKADIDFIVLGGDLITGWRDKATAIDGLQKITAAMEKAEVPVIITRGNHDLNDNPEFPAQEEKLNLDEFYFLTQAVVRKDNFVYDVQTDTKDENTGLYFYVDIPEKKTRAICLDSFNTPHSSRQVEWLATEVLTVKDEGWKYVFLSHIPVDIRYEAEMTDVISGADDIKALTTALNNRTTATGNFGTIDFSGFKSNVVAFNFGHVHNSYMEYNAELKAACIATGQGGAVGDGKFDYIKSDDEHTRRNTLENTNAQRYLFDIISTNAESTARIRFGNGIDKTVEHQ